MALEFSKLKFLCKLPCDSGWVTAIRETRVQKEDYEAFYYTVQEYFADQMEYEEYSGLLEAQGKPVPGRWDEGDTDIFGTLNAHFGRCFVVSDVEFVEKEEDGTLVYRILAST